MLATYQFNEQKASTNQEDHVSSDLMLLFRLDEMISWHFRQQKDPEFYSAELAIPIRRLNEITKRFHRQTLFRTIQDHVLLEAKLLLVRSKMSSKLIAYELGFDDPSYFCRFFKRFTSLTPCEYRKSFGI